MFDCFIPVLQVRRIPTGKQGGGTYFALCVPEVQRVYTEEGNRKHQIKTELLQHLQYTKEERRGHFGKNNWSIVPHQD